MIRRLSYWLLKRSIAKHRCCAPVLVTKDFRVIDGNRRVQACRELGLHVPIVIVPDYVEVANPHHLFISCPVDLREVK